MMTRVVPIKTSSVIDAGQGGECSSAVSSNSLASCCDNRDDHASVCAKIALMKIYRLPAIWANSNDSTQSKTSTLKMAKRKRGHGCPRGCILLGSLYPQDLEVVRTLLQDTPLRYDVVPLDAARGTVALEVLREYVTARAGQLAGVVFPQVNALGCLEDADSLTDLAHAAGARAIVVIDPMLLATGGLKAPATFGSDGTGADLLVGEGQTLAIASHFGGPGLGIFGIRFNAEHRQDIRSAPGRFVGDARDMAGRQAKVMVLSTREQHIRREKATSNICTNQGFVATLAAAAVLGRGEQGMQEACAQARSLAHQAARTLVRCPGVRLAFPETPFFHEFTLALPCSSAEMIETARQRGIHLGVDVSARVPGSHGNHLPLSIRF